MDRILSDLISRRESYRIPHRNSHEPCPTNAAICIRSLFQCWFWSAPYADSEGTAILGTCWVPNTLAQKATAEETLKSATYMAEKIRAATGNKKKTAKAIPNGNPCDILSQGDLQRPFPERRQVSAARGSSNMALPNVPGEALRARWC